MITSEAGGDLHRGSRLRPVGPPVDPRAQHVLTEHIPPQEEFVIALEGVEKSFGSQPVLRGVDLEIRQGETFTILGGSGSGKSVSLKHMIGLMRPRKRMNSILGPELS